MSNWNKLCAKWGKKQVVEPRSRKKRKRGQAPRPTLECPTVEKNSNAHKELQKKPHKNQLWVLEEDGVSEIQFNTKSTTPLTHVLIEIQRLEAIRKIRAVFKSECGNLGIKQENQLFERALLQRLDSETDPIIPGPLWAQKIVRPIFEESKVSPALTQKVCLHLDVAVARIQREFEEFEQCNETVKEPIVRILRSRLTGKGARRAQLERIDPDLEVVDLQVEETTVRINERHYEKMRQLFELQQLKTQPNDEAAKDRARLIRGNGWIELFHRRLFVVLVRYRAVQGGGFQGGGMQAAMPEETFAVLRHRFGAAFECFASPLNCRYRWFCSLFHDTDAPFGSGGSFWHYRPKSGSFQANPPFDSATITRLAAHIDDLLQASASSMELTSAEKGSKLRKRKRRKEKQRIEETGGETPKKNGARPLSFVVVVPAWKMCSGWKAMRRSKFLSKHLLLQQKEHGYCEGLQHCRPTRYRVATADTSVFFLQNKSGRQKWPPSDVACRELRAAFRSKHVRVAAIKAAKQAWKARANA